MMADLAFDAVIMGLLAPGRQCRRQRVVHCYKIMAKDLNLAKPWEDSDKKEPDSLVDQLLKTKSRVEGSARPGESG